MRKMLVGAVLAGLLMSGSAQALDKCMTGSWYDPDVKFQGISIEVLNTSTLVYYYTYSFFNKTDQNWVLFEGSNGNPASLVAYDTVPSYTNLEFDPILYIIGTGEVQQLDNDTILFSYDFDLNLDNPDYLNTPWCLDGECKREFVYTRLTQPIPCN